MRWELTVALEPMREKVIEDAGDFKVLLGAGIESICASQFER
jgi:hypothetical protein